MDPPLLNRALEVLPEVLDVGGSPLLLLLLCCRAGKRDLCGKKRERLGSVRGERGGGGAGEDSYLKRTRECEG